MISYKQIELLNEAYSKMNGVSGSFGSYTIVQKIESIIDYIKSRSGSIDDGSFGSYTIVQKIESIIDYIKSRSGSIDDVTEGDFDYKVFMLLIEIINWLDDNSGGDVTQIIVEMTTYSQPGISIKDFDNNIIFANGLEYKLSSMVPLIYTGDYGRIDTSDEVGFPQINLTKSSGEESFEIIEFKEFHLETEVVKPFIKITDYKTLASMNGVIYLSGDVTIVFKERVGETKYFNMFDLPSVFKYTFNSKGSGHVWIECTWGEGTHISLAGNSKFDFSNKDKITNLKINDVSETNLNQEFSFNGVYKIEFDMID